jgi:hypothetical protein
MPVLPLVDSLHKGGEEMNIITHLLAAIAGGLIGFATMAFCAASGRASEEERRRGISDE